MAVDEQRDLFQTGQGTAKFAYLISLGFQNGLEDHNADARLNGNAYSTLSRHLVRFGPVTPEFIKLECVQQASISTGFAGSPHCSTGQATQLGSATHFWLINIAPTTALTKCKIDEERSSIPI